MSYTNTLPTFIKHKLNKYNYTVAFNTNNNIGNKILYKNTVKDISEKSGIYKMICSDCDNLYIGQTGRKFYKRYIEHLPKNDIFKCTSNFALHLMNHNHSDNINFKDNCIPIHVCSKGRIMDALEEIEIYKQIKEDPKILLNDKLNFKSHCLYDTALYYKNNNNKN